MKISLSIYLAALVVFLGCGRAHAQAYHFLYQWGDNRPDLDVQLTKPRGVAVDGAGNVYVSDVGDNKIVKYDSNGNIIKSWTTCGGTSLDYPMEMTVDSSNRLYVADMLNNRICIYDSNGNWLGIISSSFNKPLGVTTDDSGNIYVTDRRNNEIKKFNGAHALVATWTGIPSPWGIVYYGGYLYVTTGGRNLIRKLKPDGSLVKEWGTTGTGVGQFEMAEGIVVYNDQVYVADGEYGRIHVFDLDGDPIKTIGERGTGNGQLQFSSALAVDSNNGWLYVSDDDNDRVMKFDADGNYLDQWGCDSSGDTGLRYPTKLAVDNKHRVIYVVDSGNQRIIKMSMKLVPLASWGGYGDGDGQFRFPIAAAVDSSGNVYVVDSTARDVQKFDSKGVFKAKWQINFDPLIYDYGLNGIAIDSHNNVYVVDAGTDKLYKLGASGKEISAWDVPYYPTDVALDEANNFIYVSAFGVNTADADSVIQYKMDNGAPTGRLIGQGVVYHPYDVTIDRNGDLIVASTFSSLIVKFDSNGNILASLGTEDVPGNGPGDLDFPYGVATDDRGDLYVADTNNHRIEKFTPDIYIAGDTAPYACVGQSVSTRVDRINVGSSMDKAGTSLLVDGGLSILYGGAYESAWVAPGQSMPASWTLQPLAEGNYLVTAVSSDAGGTFYDDMPIVVETEGSFADVPCEYWAFGHIEKLYQEGITGGCWTHPLSYCPDLYVTRGEMATFIVKTLFGDNPVCHGGVLCADTTPYFKDVPKSNMFFRFIQKMKEEGITGGCGGGDYCPDRNLTRAEMAVFIVRARRAATNPDASQTFNDVPPTNIYYDYVEALARLGITSGCSLHSYCPSEFVTRAMMAVFLVRGFF